MPACQPGLRMSLWDRASGEKWGFNRALGEGSGSAAGAAERIPRSGRAPTIGFKKVPCLRAPTPPQTLPQERFSQAIGWLSQPASQASE